MKIYLDGSFDGNKSISSISFKDLSVIKYILLEYDKQKIFINDQVVGVNSFVSEILAFYLFFNKVMPRYFSKEQKIFLYTDCKVIYEFCNYLTIPAKKYSQLITNYLKEQLEIYQNIEVFYIQRDNNFADLSFLGTHIYETKIQKYTINNLKLDITEYSDLKIQDVYYAYYKARKNKKRRKDFLIFEQDLDSNLEKIFQDLINLDYQPKPYTCFLKQEKKLREIFMADIQDLIVQHIVLEKIRNRFEQNFIYDVFNHKLGKGIHKAWERLQYFMRSSTGNWDSKKQVFYLKGDIKGFFFYINRNILLKKLQTKIKEDWILKVLDSYLRNHPTDYFIPGIGFNLEFLKSCKHSLFCIEKHRGLPLGNVFSQFFANIYLSEFDFFIKVKLGLKYYIRYADDFVIIHEDLDYLKNLKKQIKKYLKSNLDLELSLNKTYIKNTKQGIRFLGKRFFWYDRYKLIAYFYEKFNNNLNKGLMGKKDCKSVVNSYMGFV